MLQSGCESLWLLPQNPLPFIPMPYTGSASPLGASPAEGGVNFALAAPHATAVTLCLYNADNSPLQELKLHNTGAGRECCTSHPLLRSSGCFADWDIGE